MSLINEFESLLKQLDQLQYLDYDSAFNLLRDCRVTIKIAFTSESEYLLALNSIYFKPVNIIYNSGHHTYNDQWLLAKGTLESILLHCIQELRLAKKYPKSQATYNDNTNHYWYKKPYGIIILAVISGIILLIIRHLSS